MTARADLAGLIGRLRPQVTDIGLIRLGPDGNGGYLVPDDLVGIEACFSPGVSDSSDFELACAEKGMKVFLADYSVDGPATLHGNFHFTKKFVGATTSDCFMTIADWVRYSAISADSDLLLQMDIEGYEYETLLSMPDDLLKRFRIMGGRISPPLLLIEQAILSNRLKRVRENSANAHLCPPASKQLPFQPLHARSGDTEGHGIHIPAE